MATEREIPGDRQDRTALPLPLARRLLLLGVLPVALALSAMVVPALIRLIGPTSLPTIGYVVDLLAGAVGAVLGVLVAMVLLAGSARITLTDGEVCVDQDGQTTRLPRADVAAVFADGGNLVIQDRESRQIVCSGQRAAMRSVSTAFRAHGYPWADRDPYGDLYRLWEPGTPDLPPLLNDILAARKLALGFRSGREARALRDSVQRVGFAVRDNGSRQYWRVLVRSL